MTHLGSIEWLNDHKPDVLGEYDNAPLCSLTRSPTVPCQAQAAIQTLADARPVPHSRMRGTRRETALAPAAKPQKRCVLGRTSIHQAIPVATRSRCFAWTRVSCGSAQSPPA